MLPGESTEQDGHVLALLGGEGSLHGTMEVDGLVEPGYLSKARTFGCEPLLDL